MCRNRQGVLVHLAGRVRELVDEIGFSWVLEGLSFDSVCSVIAGARSAEVERTGLALRCTWIPYGWNLARYLTWLKPIRSYRIGVPLKAKFPSLVEKWCLPLFVSPLASFL